MVVPAKKPPETNSILPWATEKLFNLRRTPLWATALVVLATVAVYANSFQGVFIFDDEYAIENNPTIRSLWPLGRVFASS